VALLSFLFLEKRKKKASFLSKRFAFKGVRNDTGTLCVIYEDIHEKIIFTIVYSTRSIDGSITRRDRVKPKYDTDCV